jgi:uncharacterized protein (TIGR03663 family)
LKSFEVKPDQTVSGEFIELPEEAEDLENLGERTEVVAQDQIAEEALSDEMAPAAPAVEDDLESFPVVDYASFPGNIPDDARPPRSRWPTRQQLINWTPYWAVLLLAALLRFWNLGSKPLHHDESLHAYFSLQLLHNLQNWAWCYGLDNAPAGYTCYQYDPVLHGPFQFHAIALVYQISQWLGAPDNGVNTTTVRIAAALLGTLLVILPYFLRDYLGKFGAWLGCFLLAVSPSMVYFSRFAREDIYMACFTLLMVVATARYFRERKMRWIVLASAGFALSYATSEATFLTIAVFGSFLGGMIMWEIGSKIRLQLTVADREVSRLVPRTLAPVILGLYVVVAGIAAKILFSVLDRLSAYINANTSAANVDLANLEATTIRIIPWLGILLGLYVFSILLREMYGKLPVPGRRGLARLVDRRQPVLDTILTMPWTHWFFALIVGWGIFLLLFTVVFTNIIGGIGDGIWKGIFYWIEQQNVARGGQPWYYYLLLIPLYEQIGVVFGIVGIVRCLLKPDRFRLFLVYWFLGDFVIYSWAGEKMPWLMIFMTMPMMLLAAIGIEPCALACYRYVKERFFSGSASPVPASVDGPVTPLPAPRRIPIGKPALGLFGVVMAFLLLLPTLHNMYEVSYVDPATGPLEMMIYVQTTYDVNTVMANIDAVNQKDFAGNHQMRIGVTSDATWPFAWYLRDYTNVCYNYPTACPTWQNAVPVVVSGGDDPYGDLATYSDSGKYLSHMYDMRTWWDEGYKMPPCPLGQPSSATCANPEDGTGVGPGLWLSYGDNPPPNAKFNLGLTVGRIWDWWWYRQPFGSTAGAYNMELFIQNGLGVKP